MTREKEFSIACPGLGRDFSTFVIECWVKSLLDIANTRHLKSSHISADIRYFGILSFYGDSWGYYENE